MDENPYQSPLSPSDRTPNRRQYSPMVKSVIRGSILGAFLLVGLNLVFLRYLQWRHQQGYRMEGNSPASVLRVFEATCCSAFSGGMGGAFVGGVARWIRQKLASD